MTGIVIRASAGFVEVATEPARNIQTLLTEQGFPCARRTNRFTKLALLGAHRCVSENGVLASDCSLYLASGQGNVADTAELMQQIVRDGLEPQPITFINVSSNMAGYYVANAFGLRGRNIAVARRAGAWESALELACLDLARGRTPIALVGAVEECAYPLAEHRRRLGLNAEMALLENSCWLVLSADGNQDAATTTGYRRFVAASELLAHVAQTRPASETVWLHGPGVEQAVAAELERSLGRAAAIEALPGVSETASAALLVKTLQRRRPGAVLYINGDRASGYWAFHFAVHARSG